MKSILVWLLGLPLGACAGVQFQEAPSGDALMYFEPQPYFLIQQDSTCVQTAKVVSVPGHKRALKLKSGYGSAELSVALTPDGVLTNVGQKTDTKIPETITAVTGLATGLAKIATSKAGGVTKSASCRAAAAMYPIVDGRIDTSHPVKLTL